jgi:hypothetical protein
MPAWVDDCPSTEVVDDFFMAAFWDLSSCRQFGFGAGPIPWDTMVAYAEFHGLEYDVACVFIQIMREMDGVWLEWEAEEADRRKKEEQFRNRR